MCTTLYGYKRLIETQTATSHTPKIPTIIPRMLNFEIHVLSTCNFPKLWNVYMFWCGHRFDSGILCEVGNKHDCGKFEVTQFHIIEYWVPLANWPTGKTENSSLCGFPFIHTVAATLHRSELNRKMEIFLLWLFFLRFFCSRSFCFISFSTMCSDRNVCFRNYAFLFRNPGRRFFSMHLSE